MRTNFKVAPNVRFRYRYSISTNNQGTNTTTFFTNAPSIDFDAYIWKAFTLKSNYSYNTLSDKTGQLNSFQTWDASLSYRKNKDARWEYVTFRTDYTYTNQRAKGGDSDSFETWNASLSYRKDRDAKWEYEVRASNLLNIDSRLSNSANNLFVASSETFIQPRFITFRLRYVL